MSATGGTPPYRSDLLETATGPALRPGGTELTERALTRCAFPAGARLLDIGCGSGASVAFLRKRGFAATGIDLSASLLAAGRTAGLPLARADAAALPCRDNVLDGALCECVLCLLPDPARVLREIAHALRPGGRLILSDLYRRRPAAAPELRDHREVEALVTGAGLEPILWEDHSDHLARLAAQLLLTHGSLEALCQTAPGASRREERPGYFLMVAAKSAG